MKRKNRRWVALRGVTAEAPSFFERLRVLSRDSVTAQYSELHRELVLYMAHRYRRVTVPEE